MRAPWSTPAHTGCVGFTADVLMGNPAMLKVFRRGAGHTLRMDADAGVYEVRMTFTEVDVLGVIRQ